MPNRYLFEDLLTSERWNDLAHAEQAFYVRLILVADDFGCYDGRDAVIANACFPTHRVDVQELMQALHDANMVVRYSNAGKPYIAIMRWRNEVRGKRRFPAPPVNNDAPDLHYAGKYGRPVGWRNPGNTDEVSILLDAQMRPVIPQPIEWRVASKGYAPAPTGEQALRTMESKPYAPPGVQALSTTGAQPLPTGSGIGSGSGMEKEVEQAQAQEQEPQSSTSPGAQGLREASPTAAANGEVILENGDWKGITEAQRLKWQDMFPGVSIPDQLARAAAWLDAHPEEHAAYGKRHQLHAFLVRWLLREARNSPVPTKRVVDA